MSLSKLTTVRQTTLCRTHVALLVLFARRRIPLGTYVSKLLEQLATIGHQTEGHTAAMRCLADGFVSIFTTGNDAPDALDVSTASPIRHVQYANGEHLLFDSWLPKHLAICAAGEQDRILQCINALLVKSAAVEFALSADEAGKLVTMLAALYATMLPYVLGVFVRADASRSIAELAANLCLGCAMYDGRLAYGFEETFAMFAGAAVANLQ